LLAKDNRVTRPADFREIVRSGRRYSTPHAVLHVVKRDSGEHTRFGFIVTKAVGGAVRRNLIRRRLRALSHEVLSETTTTSTVADVVIRALPGSEQASWDTLHSEIAPAIRKAVG
jgi:ribonuclease P protein component